MRRILALGAVVSALVIAVASCGDFLGGGDTIVEAKAKRECPPGHQKKGWCVPETSYIEVIPDTAIIEQDSTAQFTATAYDDWNGEVIYADTMGTPVTFYWETSDTLVATVDTLSGLVTGVADGEASVIARINGISDTALVIVDTPEPPPPPDTTPAYVVVSPDSATIEPDSTVQFAAQAYNSADSALNATFQWSVEDTLIASVDNAGLATGVADGTTSVVATLGLLTGSATLTVEAPAPPPPPDTTPAYVVVTPDSATIEADSTVQYSAQAYNSADSALAVVFQWSVGDTLVASVDNTGLVTGLTDGETTVLATVDSISGSAVVTVSTPEPPPPPDTTPAYIVVSPDSVNIEAAETAQFNAQAYNSADSALDATFDWSTGDAAVASVDASGLVTGVADGQTVVIATLGSLADSAVVVVDTYVPPPPPSGADGIWISQAEINALPTSGAAWDAMVSDASGSLLGGKIDVRDDHNARMLAAALVAARLNDDNERARVRDGLIDLMDNGYGTEDGLARNRRLGTYAVVADIIDLPTFDPATNARFAAWLAEVRDFVFNSGGGGSLPGYHERRPNNYGLHAGFSRMAVALYLGDTTDFERAVTVFRGWLGERSFYAGFDYGDLSWQADPANPVGINPLGATIDGHDVDGVQPDDQRRCGTFVWPPCLTNYAWEGLQGVVAMAYTAYRQGYPTFEWSDQAVRRAVRWLYEVAGYPAEGDDTWSPYIINAMYGTDYSVVVPSSHGKNMGYTDWTLQNITVPPFPADTTTPPPVVTGQNIWLSQSEIEALPTTGVAWDKVISDAGASWGTANVSDQDSKHDNFTLAGALACARVGQYCEKTLQGLRDAVGTEQGDNWLAVSRNLGAYLIASDIMRGAGYSDPTVEEWFATWPTRTVPDNGTGVMRTIEPFHSGSNASSQEGFVAAALGAYLGDQGLLDFTWETYRTFVCAPGATDPLNINIDKAIEYGWVHDEENPCAVNPLGSSRTVESGLPGAGGTYRLDGSIGNDMRRGGAFQWPPGWTQYPWTGLAGVVPAAVVLDRAGYSAFTEADNAVARMFDYMWFLRIETGNIDWFDGSRGSAVTQLVNYFYGMDYPVDHPVRGGHTLAYTDWTHPTSGGTQPPTDYPPPPSGTALYVAPSGSNGNDGSFSSPWGTVGYGISQLQAGDTLYVRGGTYDEDIQSPSIASGLSNSRITVMAYPGERPVVKGYFWMTGADYWTFNGINVTWDSTTSGDGHQVKLTRGVGWVWENSEVWGGVSLGGILVYGYGNGEPADWVVRNNCIHDVSRASTPGTETKSQLLYINTSNDAGSGLIEGNVLFNAPNGHNVKLGYGSDYAPDRGTVNVTVRYNTMDNARRSIIVADSSWNNVFERNIVMPGGDNLAIRAYKLTGSPNVYQDNFFGVYDLFQYADDGYLELTDGGGNIIGGDPQFNSTGTCEGYVPTNPDAFGYGHSM